MKKASLHIIFFSICISSFSQYKDEKPQKYFSEDQILFDFNYNHWLINEGSFSEKWNSFGCSAHAMYSIFGNNSNISLAAGFGFNKYNINLDCQPIEIGGITQFQKIPANIDYSKNKISLSYFEVPLELRIRTNPNYKRKSFKFYIGFKAAYLLNSYTKYVGDDPTSGKKIKIKNYYIPNIMQYQYGITTRIGFGKLNFKTYYSLVPLFIKDKGPDITPVNIGISIFLF